MFMVLSLPAIAFENMNGDYVITKTPNAGTAAYNTKWGDYRNELGGVEYFDMYVGPFTSLYSQVWWAALPAVEMPDDIKKRFNDSAMAILGYEVDQVRKKGDKDVDGSILAEDVSVPINVAYNVRNPPPASCFSLPSSPPFLCVPPSRCACLRPASLTPRSAGRQRSTIMTPSSPASTRAWQRFRTTRLTSRSPRCALS